MTCGLVHANYSLPEWQAIKLTFFAPCLCYTIFRKDDVDNQSQYTEWLKKYEDTHLGKYR